MRAAVVSAAGGDVVRERGGDGGDVGEHVRGDVTVIAVVAVTSRQAALRHSTLQ